MPSRLACLAILLYWAVAASSLIRRDILPELRFVRPPDLRSIARAGGDDGPTHWSVQVVDPRSVPEGRRTVGDAVTESVRTADGWVQMTSRVKFDSGSLLPQDGPPGARADVEMIDRAPARSTPPATSPSFRASVLTSSSTSTRSSTVEGHPGWTGIEVGTHGPLPILNQTRTIPYQPRRHEPERGSTRVDRLPAPGQPAARTWVVNPAPQRPGPGGPGVECGGGRR